MEKPNIVQEGLDRLISFWENKPVVKGKIKAELEEIQSLVDAIFEVVEGTTLTSAVDKQLDNYGELFDVERLGRSNDEYRSVILNKIANQTTSGTPTELINLIKTTTGASYGNIYEYESNHRYAILYASGVVTETLARSIDSSAPAGAKIDVLFDATDTCLVPAIAIQGGIPDILGATTDSGLDSVGARVSATEVYDISLYTNSNPIVYYYPRGADRAILPLDVGDYVPLQTHALETIQAITATGIVPIEISTRSLVNQGLILAHTPVEIFSPD